MRKKNNIITDRAPTAFDVDAHLDALAFRQTDLPHAGMPELDETAYETSVFEFWPFWVFYLPIIVYILWLGLRYRGATLMTASNPAIPMSGFVGESKLAVLDAITGSSRDFIANYTGVTRKADIVLTLREALDTMALNGLDFPLVAKPDLGMRGAGVQVITSAEDLQRYIIDFPEGGDIVLQELIDAEGEVGLFYVKIPGEGKGKIIGQTLKYFPKVTGDGQSTLRELIAQDRRAGKLAHLYLDRHRDHLDTILPLGKTFRLAFAGSHSRGAIFRNGNDLITDAITDRFDQISQDIGEFYVGRFDVRFANFGDLQAGKGFRILEVNGAGGESTHIWDSRTSLWEAWTTLFQQYRYLWQIGYANRARGFKPVSVKHLYTAWRKELDLTAHYPLTH